LVHDKRDNTLNNDAWNKIKTDPSELLHGGFENIQSNNPDNFEKSIQNSNLRAEFFEFNIEGIKQKNRHLLRPQGNQKLLQTEDVFGQFSNTPQTQTFDIEDWGTDKKQPNLDLMTPFDFNVASQSNAGQFNRPEADPFSAFGVVDHKEINQENTSDIWSGFGLAEQGQGESKNPQKANNHDLLTLDLEGSPDIFVENHSAKDGGENLEGPLDLQDIEVIKENQNPALSQLHNDFLCLDI